MNDTTKNTTQADQGQELLDSTKATKPLTADEQRAKAIADAQALLAAAGMPAVPKDEPEVLDSKYNWVDPKLGNYRDKKAPESLTIVAKDQDGNELVTLVAATKIFKSGSVGFYANEKMTNMKNALARYQIGFTCTLIGSKEGELGSKKK